MIEIRKAMLSNWFTEKGVRAKRREIVKKGLPNPKGCLMFTLTTSRHHGDPLTCWQLGNDKMRRFLGGLRDLMGVKRVPWAWKLELHEDSYPHWHLIVDFEGRRIPKKRLQTLNHLWGLGRVNVKQLTRKKFNYLFKYVSKAPFGMEDSETKVALPKWILDYQQYNSSGKPTTRIRFWQTGGGFYTNQRPVKKTKAEKKYSLVPYTYRALIKIWDKKATVVLVDKHGNPKTSRQILLSNDWEKFENSLIEKMRKGIVTKVNGGYAMMVSDILREIEPWNRNLRQKVRQLLHS